MPITAEDDSDPAGRVSADTGTEDLQIPATAARAAMLHVAITPRLQASHNRRRRHEGHYVTGQRTQAEDGQHGEAD